jgi:hypothetical protein
MTAPTRKPFLDRLTALAVAPYLLGRQAISLMRLPAKDSPPEPLSQSSPRLVIAPPEHAIKRRG